MIDLGCGKGCDERVCTAGNEHCPVRKQCGGRRKPRRDHITCLGECPLIELIELCTYREGRMVLRKVHTAGNQDGSIREQCSCMPSACRFHITGGSEFSRGWIVE